MWLVNTLTLELEQVPSHGPEEVEGDSSDVVRPAYAILSHRWRSDELTFQDMRNHTDRESKAGWLKLNLCCTQARDDGIGYAWVDTCCINKESDAELTEAINSMYRWYRDAEVCYLYMDDIGQSSMTTFDDASVWTRGWCLQELIAPRRLVCFDYDWAEIGSREELKHEISLITTIDLDLLSGSRRLESYSIAERMSWAARRKTTRPEDRAYSLIGLFGVSMPMIYGEGAERSFLRLQSEIMKDTDDHSIFAWPGTVHPSHCSLLARSPLAFAGCSNIWSISTRHGRKPFSITNRGVSITLRMTPWDADTYLAVLNCGTPDYLSYEEGSVGIFLRRLYEEDSYIRISVQDEDVVHNVRKRIGSAKDASLFAHPDFRFKETLVNVPQARLSPRQMLFYQRKVYGFRLAESLFGQTSDGRKSCEIMPGHGCEYIEAERMVVKHTGTPMRGPLLTIYIHDETRRIRRARIFMDDSFNPICFLAEATAIRRQERQDLVRSEGVVDSEGETSQRQHFESRTLADTHGWNTFTRSGNQLMVRPSTLRQGLWQIRGDRIDGLNAVLLFVPNRTQERYARITILEKESDRGLVWEIEIDG